MTSAMGIRYHKGYINEHDLIKLRELKKIKVELDVMGVPMDRKMVELDVFGKIWLADIVTGSLHDPQQEGVSTTKTWIRKIYRGRNEG
jgi:hypothetical protein